MLDFDLFPCVGTMGSKAAEYVSRTTIGAYFHSARESRKLVLVIVAIALLLDNMLLTTVGINLSLSMKIILRKYF